MTKSEEAESPTETPKVRENAMLTMISTMADTTWRMFVPILGLLLLGIFADKALGIFPWLTLVGFVLGVAFSLLLIRSQLRKGTK